MAGEECHFSFFVIQFHNHSGTVRSSATLALGKLSALSTRVDLLVGDLLNSLQATDSAIREAILTALKGELKHAGKNVGSVVRIRVYSMMKDLIHNEDDEVRICTADILGIISQKHHSIIMANITIFGPALGECMKDGSTQVRPAAERCALACWNALYSLQVAYPVILFGWV